MPRQNAATATANGSLPPRRFSVTITSRSLWLEGAPVVGILLAVLLMSRALATPILLLLAIILGASIRPLVVRMERRRIPGPLAVMLI